jgi:hypothetical protein
VTYLQKEGFHPERCEFDFALPKGRRRDAFLTADGEAGSERSIIKGVIASTSATEHEWMAKMFHVKHLCRNFAGKDFIVDSLTVIRSADAAPRMSTDRR